MSDILEMNVGLGLNGLKSGARQSAEEFVFDGNGLFGDRMYMFVEACGENLGKFISQRADGTLALVHSEVTDAGIKLTHPDVGESPIIARQSDGERHRLPVSVHSWRGYGVDQGKVAAEWGRELLERDVKLVGVSETHPRYVENNPNLGQVGFSDGYPLLVVSKGSIQAVSEFMEREGLEPIEAVNFGPNIILDSDTPFIEDSITTIQFESEGMMWELLRRKACGRCKMPSRRPQDGEMREGISVLEALASMGRKGIHADDELFGKKPERFLGQNFIVVPPKELDRGQKGVLSTRSPVSVVLSDATNWTPAA